MKNKSFVVIAINALAGSALMLSGCSHDDKLVGATPLPSQTASVSMPSIDANIEAGDSAFAAQDWDRALASYRTALRHYLPTGTSDQRGTRAYALRQSSLTHEKIAERAHDNCEYQTGVDHLHAALAAYPDNQEARGLLGTYLTDLRWWRSGQEQGSQFVYDPEAARQVASADTPIATTSPTTWIGGNRPSYSDRFPPGSGREDIGDIDNPGPRMRRAMADQQMMQGANPVLPPVSRSDAQYMQQADQAATRRDAVHKQIDAIQAEEAAMGSPPDDPDALRLYNAHRKSLQAQEDALYAQIGESSPMRLF